MKSNVQGNEGLSVEAPNVDKSKDESLRGPIGGSAVFKVFKYPAKKNHTNER